MKRIFASIADTALVLIVFGVWGVIGWGVWNAVVAILTALP